MKMKSVPGLGTEFKSKLIYLSLGAKMKTSQLNHSLSFKKLTRIE